MRKTDQTFSVVADRSLMYTEFIRAVSLCNGGVPVFYFQMIGAAVCPRDIKSCIDGQRECAVCPAIDGDRDGIAGGVVRIRSRIISFL